jgi:hypothetical protein
LINILLEKIYSGPEAVWKSNYLFARSLINMVCCAGMSRKEELLNPSVNKDIWR